ncbi:ABC transporter permease [Shimia aestuarii]|uniref:Phospholipid/cholesterol/gamma-HCH transport system permease protein n=1 Tax=Shimia aestuarii TaxID=254406 RepID=A0A1I4HKD6_9RHOB|nr:MlaE family lipid ABC transporter permease subunit [Shimia aestuarii]SFL42594.1 phospholipid/cholesterol/gamma-HCH transport system permease protein [Shimia aestuarii]
MSAPTLILEGSDNGSVLRLAGRYLTHSLGTVEKAFADVDAGGRFLEIDMSGVEVVDTGGAWLIVELMARLEADGLKVTLINAAPSHLALIETVREAIPEEPGEEEPERGLLAWLERVGREVERGKKGTLSILSFFGETLAALARAVVMPWKMRWAPLVSQMDDVGFKAVPIVALMGFLIGIVLAFQGATQLQQFGAEVFVVELISISILRELGILLTAIIVAGRSGSAFTASVGSMKVQEEIDAMRTLGLNPIDVLVLPRVLALLIMLPILGFVANMSGLFGGALMSWLNLNVSPGMFVTRLQETTSIWHLGVGMIKAPFFALVIGVIACWQAFQVRGSSTSVGQRTTASVVQSIFMVIALDALFSVFFAKMGV